MRRSFAAPLVTIAAIIIIGWNETPNLLPDANAYLEIASGHLRQTPAPFSHRVLAPLIARGLTLSLNIPLLASFHIVSLAAFVLFTITIFSELRKLNIAFLLMPLLVVPALTSMFGDACLPDMLNTALIAVFFLLLHKSRPATASVVLVLGFASRESTLVVALASLACFLIYRDYRTVAMLSVATLVGLAITALAGRLGAPNVQGLPSALYLFLKIPDNTLKNLLGIVLVPNTLRGHPGYTCPPVATFRVSLGHIRDFGVCSPDFRLPLRTILSILTTFGILPAVAISHGRQWKEIWSRPWLSAAAVAGLIQFVAAPTLGAAYDRLLTYGWPLFWLAVPSVVSFPFARWVRLGILNLAVSWLFVFAESSGILVLSLSILASLAAQSYAWHVASSSPHPAPTGSSV